jgi:hypothetical protein
MRSFFVLATNQHSLPRTYAGKNTLLKIEHLQIIEII